MGRKKYTWMKDRVKKRFLDHYSRFGRVILACKHANIVPSTHYKCLERDAEYKQAFDDADLAFAEMLEAEAIRRGREGVERIVRHQGKEVGREVHFSDKNLLRVLESRHRRYQQRQEHHHTGNVGGVLVVPAASLTAEDWERAYKDKTPEVKKRFEAPIDVPTE